MATGTASYAPVIEHLADACAATTFRLIDIGCSAGIDPIWRGLGPRLRALAIDPNVAQIEQFRAAETHPGVEYLAASASIAVDHPFAVAHAGRSHWSRNPWGRLSVVQSVDLMRSRQQTLSPELGAVARTADAETGAPPS